MTLRGAKQKIWSVKECREALQQYMQDCKHAQREASSSGYQAWHAQQENTPGYSTVVTKLGGTSWNAAKIAAASDPQAVQLDVRRGRIAEEEVLEAIRRYEADCRETGRKVSRDGYQQWHLQNPDTPSIGPIERLGTWNEMRRRANGHQEVKLNSASHPYTPPHRPARSRQSLSPE